MVPKVFLALPGYHNPAPQSVLARFTAVDQVNPPSEEDRVDMVRWRVAAGSLLPKSFNTPLCEAMDLRDAGEVTHFAMLHDDVWPDNGWITTLWREMRAHDADLISAVVPIKDAPWWRSSTAIGLKSDPWPIPRFIRAQDQATLPETFGPEHVCGDGEVLLVNTGCWLADITRPWWDEFVDAGGFTFHTRTTRGKSNERITWIQPEDWIMSRFLQERGARVMATYAVPIRHFGQCWWSNYDDPHSMYAVDTPHPSEGT